MLIFAFCGTKSPKWYP